VFCINLPARKGTTPSTGRGSIQQRGPILVDAAWNSASQNRERESKEDIATSSLTMTISWRGRGSCLIVPSIPVPSLSLQVYSYRCRSSSNRYFINVYSKSTINILQSYPFHMIVDTLFSLSFRPWSSWAREPFLVWTLPFYHSTSFFWYLLHLPIGKRISRAVLSLY